MAELQFQQIALKDITPDTNQPRKFYEEHAMNELMQSVIESGVLQPILVRPKPKGKGYLLVCGERRYRASEAAGKKDIPAVIRELTDEEALQLQIVENLQRKDVHPMEEAVAFKSFIEGKNWSFDEIAKRVGKSEYYVKQRIKLNSLIEDFQKLFFQNKMTITTALMMAQLSSETQQIIFNDRVDEDDLENPRFEFSVYQNQLNNYKGDLMNSPFDIRDVDLVPGVGACSSCQFNSAVAKLFPDEAAKCNNMVCFRNKCEVSFKKTLEEAKEDPTVLFVINGYVSVSNIEEKALKAYGVDIVKNEEFDDIDKPEHPDLEDFKDDLERENYDTEEEMMENYNEALKDYNDDLKKYEDKIASGKYKKAFVLHGHSKGTYIYITLRAKSKIQPGTTKLADAENSSTKDIDAEITRLKQKEVRSKQIDENKMWEVLKPCYNPVEIGENFTDDLSPLERQAAAWALYDKLDYYNKEKFMKHFGFKEKTGITEVSENTLQNMLRFFLLDVLPPSVLHNGHNRFSLMCLQLGETYCPVEILQAKDDTKFKAEKRIKRVDARIEELTKLKKELTSKKRK